MFPSYFIISCLSSTLSGHRASVDGAEQPSNCEWKIAQGPNKQTIMWAVVRNLCSWCYKDRSLTNQVPCFLLHQLFLPAPPSPLFGCYLLAVEAAVNNFLRILSDCTTAGAHRDKRTCPNKNIGSIFSPMHFCMRISVHIPMVWSFKRCQSEADQCCLSMGEIEWLGARSNGQCWLPRAINFLKNERSQGDMVAMEKQVHLVL